jgi:hypothetical protein
MSENITDILWSILAPSSVRASEASPTQTSSEQENA